jgi:phage/plasmid-associated DNA primase
VRIGIRTDGIGINGLSAISEILLSVTGEDAFEIERKYIGAWIGKLSTRVVMFSNELIKFQDDSGALPSRFITWRMRQSFKDREDLTLTDKLLAERPGMACTSGLADAIQNFCEGKILRYGPIAKLR